MPILNWLEDTIDNLVNSLNDDFNTKVPAEAKRTHLSSDDIFGPGKKKKSRWEEKFLEKPVIGASTITP